MKILVILTVLMMLTGCGAELQNVVTGRTTLQEAREKCAVYPMTDEEWDAIVLIFQAFAEDEYTSDKVEAMIIVAESCMTEPAAYQSSCLVCLTAVVDAIW